MSIVDTDSILLDGFLAGLPLEELERRVSYLEEVLGVYQALLRVKKLARPAGWPPGEAVESKRRPQKKRPERVEAEPVATEKPVPGGARDVDIFDVMRLLRDEGPMPLPAVAGRLRTEAFQVSMLVREFTDRVEARNGELHLINGHAVESL